MAVSVRGSTDLHRGDMQLLPIRDVGVEMSGTASTAAEIAVDVGPICFL